MSRAVVDTACLMRINRGGPLLPPRPAHHSTGRPSLAIGQLGRKSTTVAPGSGRRTRSDSVSSFGIANGWEDAKKGSKSVCRPESSFAWTSSADLPHPSGRPARPSLISHPSFARHSARLSDLSRRTRDERERFAARSTSIRWSNRPARPSDKLKSFYADRASRESLATAIVTCSLSSSDQSKQRSSSSSPS